MENGNMKKVLRAAFVFFICFMTYSINNAQEDRPVDYIDAMSGVCNDLLKDTWEHFSVSVHSKDMQAIVESRKNCEKAITGSIEKVNKAKSFKGDDLYRQSVLKYLNILHSVISQDYSKIVDMQQVAEESYDNFEAYILAQKKAKEKLNESFKMLQNAEKAFAVKYNIILENTESELINKIKKASEAVDYYNKIYLIFFKSFKQEAYLLDAWRTGDVGKIEQNRKTLTKFSVEGIKKISSEKKYIDDDSLLIECSRALKFYKTEAEEKIPFVIDYLMKRESFEKMQKSFELMDKSEKTQAVIDQYNATVNEFNLAIEKSNEIGESLNKERADIVDKVNSVIAEFIDKHVPK